MNYCHVYGTTIVVVCLAILLVICVQSVSACSFEEDSFSSYFRKTLDNVTTVLLKDYTVPVLSNIKPDNHCSSLWQVHDTYTVLQTLMEKAEDELKKRIERLLTELSVVEGCPFSASENCTKSNRPLVEVLKQLKNITGVKWDPNCTIISCVSGNTIPIHGTVSASNSAVPNHEDYLQQKSESSNKTALSGDNPYPTCQTATERLYIGVYLSIVFVLFLGLIIFALMKRLCGQDLNRAEILDVEMNNREPEAQDTASESPQSPLHPQHCEPRSEDKI